MKSSVNDPSGSGQIREERKILPVRNSMFCQEGKMSIEYEILKENHETLVRDYESLQERIKLEEETYEIMKNHLQGKTKELEVTNTRLFEGCERERSEKEKYKKMLEEMKTMESELMIKNQELLLAKRKKEQEFEKMENKYVELADKFGVVEAECAYLKSLYDAEVASSGTPSAVMSGIGDTGNHIGQGENEVNHNANNVETGIHIHVCAQVV